MTATATYTITLPDETFTKQFPHGTTLVVDRTDDGAWSATVTARPRDMWADAETTRREFATCSEARTWGRHLASTLDQCRRS